MKIRMGFVSNSSSSSFCVAKEYLTETQIYLIKNYGEFMDAIDGNGSPLGLLALFSGNDFGDEVEAYAEAILQELSWGRSRRDWDIVDDGERLVGESEDGVFPMAMYLACIGVNTQCGREF